MQDDLKSLSHSKWRCKYHIVFAPKYRRQIVYGKIKADVGKILRELSERKGVEILEAECCPDHIHMLVANHLIRLHFAKKDETLLEALNRLEQLRKKIPRKGK